MTAAGFASVEAERRHLHFDHDLSALLATVRHRETNSQLMAISDAAYAAGLSRIEWELADPSTPDMRADHLCFASIRGDKPAIT